MVKHSARGGFNKSSERFISCTGFLVLLSSHFNYCSLRQNSAVVKVSAEFHWIGGVIASVRSTLVTGKRLRDNF